MLDQHHSRATRATEVQSVQTVPYRRTERLGDCIGIVLFGDHCSLEGREKEEIMATVAPSWQASNGSYDTDDTTHALARTRSKNMKASEVAGCTGDSRQVIGTKPGLNGGVTRVERKPSEKATARGRQNSLRRVKDSTDMLRERSLHRTQSKRDTPTEGTAGGREGRQFTVANVGNNGMIYLRSVIV